MGILKNKLTIQEAAEATGLSAHTLRYYERIGLIHPIEREENTRRLYTADDIGWIDFLTKLRATGMSIRDMQRYAELQRQGDETLPERLEMLKRLRDRVEGRIQELHQHLKLVNTKIEIYGQIVEEQKLEKTYIKENQMTTTAQVMRRTLGRSGLQVSALGLGCWAIGGPWFWLDGQGGWGDIDDNESVRAIHRAIDLGVNFFDTAANYGTGHSERILARALEGKRDQILIATKFGFKVDEAEKRVTFRDDDHLLHVRNECEASLRRLNTDVIDLYQLHVWDYPVEKVPAMVNLLESLVADGKIRYYGWSTDSAEGARVFAQGKHCVAIQHDLNVILDAPEMIALCEELNLSSVNRSPLARGALSGKYSRDTIFPQNDVRNDEWSHDRFFAPTFDQLEKIREILTSNGRTLVQGALAWIWARSEKTIPISGFKTVAQVEENARAMEFGPLTAEQMKEIDTLLGR